MTSQLEIQPRELKFVVELGQQSKCAVRLTNKTDQYVAFKVKTTSPKKYCVLPNVGVLEPKAALEFVVIMQAPKSGHIELTCKDKFLIQNTIVPSGTVDGYVTSEMFSKDNGNYVEESKLRVSLSTPRPSSPELTPINSTLKQPGEFILPKNVKNPEFSPVKNVENLLIPKTVNFKSVKESVEHVVSKTLDIEEFKTVKTAVEPVSEFVNNEVWKPLKTVEVEPLQDVKLVKIRNVEFEPTDVVVSSEVKDVELEPERHVGFAGVMERIVSMSEDEQKLLKDVEEMKSKLREIESKLCKAEVTISKLSEDSRLAFQDKDSLQQERAFLRKRKVERKINGGFPLLFVCMVAIISLAAGYGFQP